MWQKRSIATAIASMALACAAGALAQTRPGDVRQEDRRADRQEDRRADRQEDRRIEREREQENEVEREREAEVRFTVPRNPDGTVNFAALIDAVRAQIADLLPNDGVEHKVTLRGAVDIRVERKPDGTLRARIEDVDLGNLSAQQREQLAQQLAAQLHLERLRIRGFDAQGNRVRVEFRADRGVVRNEARFERREERRENRVERAEREQRAERRERVERRERPEREQRAERPERAEKPERPERAEKPERPERAERAERTERPERIERADRSGRH